MAVSFGDCIHFLEEAPHFADWAGKYAWRGYTHQRWQRIHGLGMVFALAFCGLASVFPNRAVAFLFFALCFSESVLNGLFHVGATALSGVYCPGLDDAARLVAGELCKCAGVETDLIDIAKLPLPTNDGGEAIKQADFSAKMGMRRISYTTNTKPRPGYEPPARNTSIEKLHGLKDRRMKHSRLK